MKSPFLHFNKILLLHISEQSVKQLERFWNNPVRAYHNINHLTEVLQDIEQNIWFNELNVEDKQSLLLAAFFHDVIYDPKRQDNEDRSIEFFKNVYYQENYIYDNVIKLIEITKSHKRPTKKIEKIFWDADHAILKQNYLRLLQYEKEVRKEYKFVPDKQYLEKRVEILNNFIGIYGSNVDNNIKKLIEYVKKIYK